MCDSACVHPQQGRGTQPQGQGDSHTFPVFQAAQLWAGTQPARCVTWASPFAPIEVGHFTHLIRSFSKWQEVLRAMCGA